MGKKGDGQWPADRGGRAVGSEAVQAALSRAASNVPAMVKDVHAKAGM